MSTSRKIRKIKPRKALRGDSLSIDLGLSYPGTMTAWMKRDPNDTTYRLFTIVDNRYLTLTKEETSDYYSGDVLTQSVEGKWYFDVEWISEEPGAEAVTIYTGTILFFNDVTESNGVQASPIGEVLETPYSIEIEQTNHGFNVGDAIKFNGTTYEKAQADTKGNAGVIGLVRTVVDANKFTYQFGGVFTKASYLDGNDYYLGINTAGSVELEPTYNIGNYKQFIGTAIAEGLLLNIDFGEEDGSEGMSKLIYDPTNKNADAFDMDNMSEGVDSKILTSSERTILNNTSGTNTGDQDISGIGINTLAIDNLELNNTGTNTGDQDISGIAINASAINTLELNNTGTNTGDQDISGIATNSNKISTLELNNTGVNTGDQDISGITTNASAISTNAGKISTLELNNTGVNTGDQDISGITTNAGNISINTSKISTLESNNTGVNTGDQDLSGLALKSNVLEKDNTSAYIPTLSYHPATKAYVDNIDVGVSKIIAGSGVSVSPGNGEGIVTITVDGSDVDYSEWAAYVGTRSNDDLVITIGDYDNSGNGTSLKINDDSQKIIASKVIKAENGIESDSNYGIVLHNVGNDGSVTIKSTLISSSSNIELLAPDEDGTIALVSQLSGIAINSGNISTNTTNITNLLNNNSGTNTGDQDISGIAINETAINVLEANNTGINTGDQDLSALALKSNVIEKDSTTVYTPTSDYHPANKKYVDDREGVTSIVAGAGISVNQSSGDVTISSDLQISDITYGASWNGNLNGASKNAIYDKIQSLSSTIPTISNDVFGSDWNGDTSGASKNAIYDKIISVESTIKDVDNTAFGSSWNGNLDGASKNAIYDKIISVESNLVTISNDVYDATWNNDLNGASKNSIYDKIESVVSTIKTIENDAYDSSWSGNLNGASKDALYAKMETFLTFSGLEDVLEESDTAISPDGKATIDIDMSNNSLFSFRRFDDGNDVEYGTLMRGADTSLYHRTGDSLSMFLATSGEARLVTSNVSDNASKTILNVPTAATDGYEFQVNLPRPTLLENTERTMPISINGNYADADGNIIVNTGGGGVTSIIAGDGISINPTGGIGNVVITSTVAGTPPVNTKGDLYTFGTTVDKLAVGNDDFVLTADSSSPTGLAWKASSGGDATLTKDVNQVGHGFSVGNVIRLDGSNYVKAQADSVNNANAISFVVSVTDVDNFVLQSEGYTTASLGLSNGDEAFLSTTVLGGIQTTEPTSGEINLYLGQQTPQGFLISISTGFVVGGGGSGGGVIKVKQPFQSNIKTDKFYISTGSNILNQNGNINFTGDFNNSVIDGGSHLEILSDGNRWFFDSKFGTINTDLSNIDNEVTPINGNKYRIIAFYNGDKIDLSISTIYTINVVPQLIEPELINPTISINNVLFDISESNTIPNEVETLMEYKESSNSEWLIHGVAIQDATNYNYDGLNLLTSYDFRCKAKGAEGLATDSNYSLISSQTTTGTSVILESDDFSGSVINSSIWNEITDLEGTLIQNNQLEFTSSGDGGFYGLRSINSYTSSNDLLIFQISVKFVNNSNNPSLGISSDPYNSNDRAIFLRSTVTNEFDNLRCLVKDNNVNEVNLNTSVNVSNFTEIRIKYKPSTGNIDFEYWNGLSWNNITSGNIDLGTSISVFLEVGADENSLLPEIVDNFYISENEYLNQFPV